MLSPLFASILKSGRTEFNRRFQEAKHTFPELSPEAFTRFLETCVDTLVVAVGNAAPQQAVQTATAAYDAALELVGQKLVGAGTQANYIEQGWSKILQSFPRLVAEAPVRAIAAVSNALHHLCSTDGARPAQWLREVSEIAPSCSTLSQLLAAGQLVAWRSGLAHYRASALAVADSLPPALALQATGAAAGSDWHPVRARLLADPWYDPVRSSATSTPRIVAAAGAFRGFGGLFPEPPLVAMQGNDLLVRSGDEAWLLVADIFGATFHRTEVSLFEKAARSTPPAHLRIHGNSLSCSGNKFKLPHAVASAAANGHTLAATLTLSHQVTLIALK